MSYINKIFIENARIIFRNFSGKPSQYNRDGKRTFSLILTPEEADRFSKEGWNVKYLKPREPGDEPTPILNVQVRYRKEDPSRDPKVYTVTGRKKTLLNENTVGTLDFAEFTNIDLLISPYRWTNTATGERGVSAYLQEAYFTMVEYFGGKYDFDEVDEDEENSPW